MKSFQREKTLLASFTALLLTLATPVMAETADKVEAASVDKSEQTSVSSEQDKTQSDATKSVEPAVKQGADAQTAERREKIIDEAVDALAQTKKALKALEDQQTEEALNALAVATGKLELLVAREPKLALAPTDVSLTTLDILGSTEAIEAAIKEARKALDRGNVQDARRMLSVLGSEMVITVANLPLATYPDAIKAITPLIDRGEIERARSELQTALNTMVLTEHVVPLPVLRFEALVAKAEKLVEKDQRSDAENKQLSDHIAAARNQLEMAELLGYGDKKDYKDLYVNLDEIRDNTRDGKSGMGFFDNLKEDVAHLWRSIVD